MKSISHTKKMSLGLFLFLAGVSVPFDILGAIPILSFLISLTFMFLVKIQLMMHGYHAGIWRMVFVFIGFAIIEVVFSLWPSNFLYVITFYAFNHHMHKVDKERILKEEPVGNI